MIKVLTAFLIAAIACVGPASADTLRTFEVGQWSAASFAFDGTKRLSHCAASADYENGMMLLFSINRDYQWSVGFAAPEIEVQTGRSFVLGLAIDGATPTKVTAQAVSEHQFTIDLAPDAALFERFRQGRQLQLFSQGFSPKFNLTGTSQLLPALLNCVRTALEPVPMQAGSSSRSTAPRSAPAADDRAEATALLANLLSQSGISGFVIEPAPADEIGRSVDASWSTKDVGGALIVVDDKSLQTPADAAPHVIAMGAKICKGTFMSGALPEEAQGSLARAFTSCRSEKGTLTAYYLTIRRPNGGHYVFITRTYGSDELVKDADANIRAAALKVLSK